MQILELFHIFLVEHETLGLVVYGFRGHTGHQNDHDDLTRLAAEHYAVC